METGCRVGVLMEVIVDQSEKFIDCRDKEEQSTNQRRSCWLQSATCRSHWAVVGDRTKVMQVLRQNLRSKCTPVYLRQFCTAPEVVDEAAKAATPTPKDEPQKPRQIFFGDVSQAAYRIRGGVKTTSSMSDCGQGFVLVSCALSEPEPKAWRDDWHQPLPQERVHVAHWKVCHAWLTFLSASFINTQL